MGIPSTYAASDGTETLIKISGRNTIFSGENIRVNVTSNSPQVHLTILNPNNLTIYSQNVAGNSSILIRISGIYGRYVVLVDSSTDRAETWFWLQNAESLTSFTLPYSWSFQGISYSIQTNYTLTASFEGKQFNVDWLSEIFTKLKPTAILLKNDYGLISIRLDAKDITANNYLMNTCFGLEIRSNGTLSKDTTLKWNFKAFNGEVLWQLDSMVIRGTTANLRYDFSGLSKRSTGIAYTIDKTNLKLDVYLSTVFDVDPVIFTDGFESGNFNAWTGTSGTPTVQTTTVKTGTYSMQASLSGGNEKFAYEQFADQTTLYAATWVRWSTLPADGQTLDLFKINRWDGDRITVCVYRTSSTYRWRLIYNGGTVATYTGAVNAINTWYWIKVKSVSSTSVGVANLYVMGLGWILNNTGLNSGADGMSEVRDTAWYSTSVTGSVYWDDTTVSSSDISDPTTAQALTFRLSESFTVSGALKLGKEIKGLNGESTVFGDGLGLKIESRFNPFEALIISDTLIIRGELGFFNSETIILTDNLPYGIEKRFGLPEIIVITDGSISGVTIYFMDIFMLAFIMAVAALGLMMLKK